MNDALTKPEAPRSDAPVERGTVWCLTGHLNEGDSIREIPIRPLPFRIGRRNDLSLSLPCRTVSSVHAELFVDQDILRVRDLQSTNGTYVNGIRVAPSARLKEGDLVQFAAVVFRIGKQSADHASGTVDSDVCDRAMALVQFDRLLEQRAVVPFFQPIVDVRDLRVVGFEMLARSRLYGLTDPKRMFMAAAQLNLESELSRMMRSEGMRVGKSLAGSPNLFLNTHPMELAESGLIESIKEVREATPEQPITLEIHEAAVTSPAGMRELRAKLTALDVKLAYDDFGAGQARLAELVEVRPDYLKFDIHLIKDVHLAGKERQNLLKHLVRMVNDLGIVPLAEGVECREESDFCKDAGFQLGQGYYYGRPAPVQSKRKKTEAGS